MKYYLREWQDVMNADDASPKFIAHAKKIGEKQEQLWSDYKSQLAKLRHRLSASAYKLLSADRDPLFDSNLLQCSIGDCKGKRLRFDTEVSIALLDCDMKWIYELSYSGVTSYEVKLPEERWYDGQDFGNLLAQEVTALSSKALQHEFLFSSGATICVAFSQLNWKRSRVVNSDAPLRIAAKIER